MDWAMSITATTTAATKAPPQAGAPGAMGAAMPNIAVGINERPINKTITPETMGAKRFFSLGRNGAKMSWTGAAASDMPNIKASPPAWPAWMSGPRNAKLVPVTLSSPEPMRP